MALIPSAAYPGQVAVDPDYPHGKARNVAVSGDGSGTPWEAQLVNDAWGFQQALLSAANVAPSGEPDKVGASDYLDSIHNLISQRMVGMALANHVPVQAPPAGAVYDMIYDGALLIASMYLGLFLTSPDGVTWTTRYPGGGPGSIGPINGLAFGSGLRLAVAGNGAIESSVNGTAWTTRFAAAGFGSQFYGAAHGAGLFVIVGFEGEIQTSTDCITWTQQQTSQAFELRGVAHNGTLFVTVGSSGKIQTSTTGEVWIDRMSAGGYVGTFTRVSYAAGLFVAVGSGGEIQLSRDGIDWVRVPSADGYTGTFNGIRFIPEGGGVWIAVGDSGMFQIAPANAKAFRSARRGDFAARGAHDIQCCAYLPQTRTVSIGYGFLSDGGIRQSLYLST